MRGARGRGRRNYADWSPPALDAPGETWLCVVAGPTEFFQGAKEAAKKPPVGRMPEHDQQQELFTTRAARLRLLDRVQLPKTKGTLPATLKAVLRAIDARAREKPTCKFNLDLLAADVGCERATIKRTLTALRALEVVETIRTGRALVFRIGWGNLADFDPLDENGLPNTAATGHTAAEELSAVSDQPTDDAPCAIRERTVSHQRAHSAPSEGAQCAIVRSASLSALETPPPPRASAGPPLAHCRDWEEVEEVLRVEFSIARWRECAGDARRRGETADVVQAAIAEFRDGLRLGRFDSAGALYQRLSSGVWPPPSAAFAKGQARAARAQAAALAEREQCERQRAGDKERQAAESLEAAWGATLDALDADGLAQLADEALAGREFLQQHFRRAPQSAIVRQALLSHLAAAVASAAGSPHGCGP